MKQWGKDPSGFSGPGTLSFQGTGRKGWPSEPTAGHVTSRHQLPPLLGLLCPWLCPGSREGMWLLRNKRQNKPRQEMAFWGRGHLPMSQCAPSGHNPFKKLSSSSIDSILFPSPLNTSLHKRHSPYGFPTQTLSPPLAACQPHIFVLFKRIPKLTKRKLHPNLWTLHTTQFLPLHHPARVALFSRPYYAIQVQQTLGKEKIKPIKLPKSRTQRIPGSLVQPLAQHRKPAHCNLDTAPASA